MSENDTPAVRKQAAKPLRTQTATHYSWQH